MNKLLASIPVVIALILGLAVASQWWQPNVIELKAATWLGEEQAKTLPDFKLTNHHGEPFTPQTIQGKWHLMFFGYTHCPDICPDTMQLFSGMMKGFDRQTLENLQVTFVSVDPDRDTLENMKQYATYFHPDILSVTGTMDQINVLTGATGILHYKAEAGDSENYEVAHSGTLILTNPQGRFIGLFSPPLDPRLIADDLEVLVNS